MHIVSYLIGRDKDHKVEINRIENADSNTFFDEALRLGNQLGATCHFLPGNFDNEFDAIERCDIFIPVMNGDSCGLTVAVILI